MLTAEWQQELNSAWRKRRSEPEPLRQRKHFMCPKCAAQRYNVKMDYLGNRHEKMKLTVYDVTYYKCPRCGYMGKEMMRIEGQGSKGFNLGKEYGGE